MIIDGPAEGNGLAFAASHFNFSVSSGASGHVNHDSRLFFAGESDSDGIGAEHALHAPKGRDQAAGIGHGPADHVVLESLENVIAGDAEMVGVADADPAGACLFRHVHGEAIRMWADNKAETVIAIHGGGAQRGTHDGDFWLGIDEPLVEQTKITVEAGYAVRIDAAKIGGSENVGGLDGVVFGDAEMKKDARAEFAQGFGWENFGLDGGHWDLSLASWRTRLRERNCDFSCGQELRPGGCWRQAGMRGQRPATWKDSLDPV